MQKTKNKNQSVLSEPATVQVGLNSFIGMGAPRSLGILQQYRQVYNEDDIDELFERVTDILVSSNAFCEDLEPNERANMIFFLRLSEKFCKTARFLFDDEYSQEHIHEFDNIRELWNTELSDRYDMREQFIAMEEHIRAEDLKVRKSRIGAGAQKD